MKTILHVAQSAGGVERYIDTLINAMNNKEWQHILVVSENYNLKKMRNISQKLFVLPMEREINIASDIKNIIKLRKIIAQCKPDIVYLHSSKAGALGRIASIGLHKNIVYNPHGWAFNMRVSKIKKNSYTLIEKFLAYFCNKIVTISNYERRTALLKKISTENKIITIYNGIDVHKMKSSISPILSDERFTVGMVGRIDVQKAPDIFVKSAIEIKKIIPNVHFIIVGDGPLLDDIKKTISENNLNNSFTITGWVDNPMGYISSFDVAMLLSRWEGFGLVIAEYMYMKKPIVGTNVDAIPELIKNNESGIIVRMDSVNEIVEAVWKYYNDSLFTEKVIKKAYQDVVEKFNSQRFAEEHEMLFNGLL